MRFDKLNEMLPYAKGGKNYLLEYSPYNAVHLAFPGRHAMDTVPVGGDYVVMIDDDRVDYLRHKFTHTDIFRDIQRKYDDSKLTCGSLVDGYLEVVLGADPEKFLTDKPEKYVGIHPHTFLRAVQCLAVAEHRRYHQFESKGGGRFLPLRFVAGIAEGLWTAADAAEKQKRGRPGVEWLEKDYGTPSWTTALLREIK